MAPRPKPPAKPPPAGQPTLAFAGTEAWGAWLRAHHATSTGLWLKLAKKDAGVASVTYAEALEFALCFGWIDGQKRAHDDAWWLQRFTPRGPRSLWSQVNREKALLLIERGEMQPAGHAAIDNARRNGQWDAAYAPAKTATVPPELEAALDRDPAAKAFFATLTGANRYAILHRLATAKKPETRAKRLAKFVEMLAKKETIHP
jgi:uncharacterized protein YdeI (YjbR/CyaY-like superfamily)